MRILTSAWLIEAEGGEKMDRMDRALLLVWVAGWIRGFCRLVPPRRQPDDVRVMAINDLSWDLDIWTKGGEPLPAAASALLAAAGWMP
jgi:hypothetical protein